CAIHFHCVNPFLPCCAICRSSINLSFCCNIFHEFPVILLIFLSHYLPSCCTSFLFHLFGVILGLCHPSFHLSEFKEYLYFSSCYTSTFVHDIPVIHFSFD